MCQHKNRHTGNKWDSTEHPEINPHVYGQLIYNKGDKNIQQGKDSLFSKWCQENWPTNYKQIKMNHYPTLYAKVKIE